MESIIFNIIIWMYHYLIIPILLNNLFQYFSAITDALMNALIIYITSLTEFLFPMLDYKLGVLIQRIFLRLLT